VAGDVVRVLARSGAPLGWAAWSGASKIALRMIARRAAPPDEAFWIARVDDALRYRRQVVQATNAWRVLFGESDGLPGLVADLYGTHLVVQVATAAAERILPTILDALSERLPLESVLARNDSAVRALEGLPREVVQLRGQTPTAVAIEEAGLRFFVHPWQGQKTGWFLDQRENRAATTAYVHGRALDVFCYQGAFALHACARAERVEAIDSSADALVKARENARVNGATNVEFREANAFDELRELKRNDETFDTILLDPPAFAKSKAHLAAARRAYKEIHLRAMQILAPDGVLVTSSCSYNLDEAEWLEVIASAAVDAHRSFRVVERRSQARDHPVRLGFPESGYLKCAVLRPT
jgi:23S rRNA (cytosine1962-C5)-methyltransferase